MKRVSRGEERGRISNRTLTQLARQEVWVGVWRLGY